MSTRKVINALKKAGFCKSEFNRSQMVRGWGTWSRGFHVRKPYGYSGSAFALVEHYGDTSDEKTAEMLAAYSEALHDAGYRVEMSSGRLAISAAQAD